MPVDLDFADPGGREATTSTLRIGDAFTPGDVLSEWIGTMAMAANDVAFAWAVRSDERADPGLRSYGGRLVLAHLNEVGKYLSETAEILPVKKFVLSLDRTPTLDYDFVLTTYEKHRGRLEALRSSTVFHYPKWERWRSQMSRAIQDCETQTVSVTQSRSIASGGRFWFADVLATAVLTRACGGDVQLHEMIVDASSALQTFLRFVDSAVDRFLQSASAG